MPPAAARRRRRLVAVLRGCGGGAPLAPSAGAAATPTSAGGGDRPSGPAFTEGWPVGVPAPEYRHVPRFPVGDPALLTYLDE